MRNKPIFAYSSGSNFGQIGDFYVDIRIFKSGTMFIKYPYGIHPIYLKTRYKLKEETINKISKIIEEDFDYIKTIEKLIDNGSIDGDYESFLFFEKEITDFNISKYLEQERVILKVFNKICKILKEEGFILKLHSFDIDESLIVKSTTRWYKNNRKDKIWWLDNSEIKGEWIFSFDKKIRFNMFSDYPYKLTSEQKEIFDKENPYWADFYKDRTL